MLWRYQFYIQVVEYYSQHVKIKFLFSSRRVILYLLNRKTESLHKQPEKAGNNIINILTGEDMENIPLLSWL